MHKRINVSIDEELLVWARKNVGNMSELFEDYLRILRRAIDFEEWR